VTEAASHSDSPPPRLWSWADFKDQLSPLNRRQFMRLSDQSKAPPYIRWTAKAPPLWHPEAVAAFIADRLAALDREAPENDL